MSFSMSVPLAPRFASGSQSLPVNRLQSAFNKGASFGPQSMNQIQSAPQVRTIPQIPAANSDMQQVLHQYGYGQEFQSQVAITTHMPQVQIGVFSLQGVKPFDPNWVNQDTHLELNLPGDKIILGVFDGHGPHGAHVANQVKNIFAEQAHTIASASDPCCAFHEVFTLACGQLRIDPVGKESGTTATVALVDIAAQCVSIANVGDSTAIVIDPDGDIVFASQDHKASDEIEAQRLRALGAKVQNGRVFAKSRNQYTSEATLALSRAIGDSEFAPQGVNGEPDVVGGVTFESGSSILIASDGVWDFVSRGDAAEMIDQSDPQDSAQQLGNLARSNWMKAHAISDDITAVVVKSEPNDSWSLQDWSMNKLYSYISSFDARILGA